MQQAMFCTVQSPYSGSLMWFNAWKELRVPWKGMVNWWGHFSVHPEVSISFSLVIGPHYSMYNVVMRGSPVLYTTGLSPSQSKLVPIYTPGLRGASYKCLAQGHNKWHTHSSNMSPEHWRLYPLWHYPPLPPCLSSTSGCYTCFISTMLGLMHLLTPCVKELYTRKSKETYREYERPFFSLATHMFLCLAWKSSDL